MATVGLKFDLDPWRKGVRSAGQLVRRGLGPTVLRPFDRAVRRSLAALRAGFAKVAGFIKAVLASALGPLIALVGVAAAIRGIQRALTGSLAAYREYDDSVKTLRASLETLGRGVDTSAAERSVKALGEQLRLAMGITGAEVNRVFGTLVTRGFDTSQARQLTILAASYAKTTGRPIEDVTKRIADAANGSLAAMRELGVEISSTGNRVRDGEAAVLALKNAYGDIGSDLANPSERLAAAWNAMATSLGEKISPIIEPIVQGFSDFVVGLTRTEEGQRMLEMVAETLQSIVSWTGKVISAWWSVNDIVKTGAAVVVSVLKTAINEVMASLFDALGKLPGGDWLMEKMGFDPEHTGAAFREQAEAAAAQLTDAMDHFRSARDGLLTGSGGNLGRFVREAAEAGRREREDAAAFLAREIEAGRSQGFAGRPAWQREHQRAEQERHRAMERGRAEMQRRVQGQGDPQGGQRVSVQIVSTRPDRFRKARFA